MAEEFLNKSGSVWTASEKDTDGKPITRVYLGGNSEENPLFIKGMQGEQGPAGPYSPKGDPMNRTERRHGPQGPQGKTYACVRRVKLAHKVLKERRAILVKMALGRKSNTMNLLNVLKP